MVAPHHRHDVTEHFVWRARNPLGGLVISACVLVSSALWGLVPAVVRGASADSPAVQSPTPRQTVPAKETSKAAPVAAPVAPAGPALLARVRNAAKQGLL